MRFMQFHWWRWFNIVVLIGWLGSFSQGEDGATCGGGLPTPACECRTSGRLQQVRCRLENGTTLSSIFDTVSNGNIENLDQLMIVKCSEPVEFLSQLPKFTCRSLQISNCGIKRVHEKAFDNLAETLEELILSFNELTIFPFLKRLKNLHVINLNNNTLHDIPEHSFDGLNNLKQIRVKNNQICVLLANALSETKDSLELLDMTGNCLNGVPAKNIRNSLNLTHLSLSNNQIGDIAPMQFMNLPSLIELRLNGNRLTKISPNVFLNVPQLRNLFLRGNQLKKLEAATLQAFKGLEKVDLGQNQLQKVPSFKDFSELRLIDLGDNGIEKIDTMTFSNNPKLDTIILRNNQIATISRNSFDALEKMSYLTLENNTLTTLERFMFDGMKNLLQLNVANNRIKDISPTAFSSMTNIVAIFLSNNRIEKLKSGTFAGLPKLNFISLSNNTKLTQFERGSFQGRIGSIALDGIDLNCDKDFDWFVSYLVQFNVRTFFPSQPDIRCASPPEMAGQRLKDLMLAKTNETIANSMQNIGLGQGGASGRSKIGDNFLSRFLPGLTNENASAAIKSIPVLHSLSQAMPSLREVPGLNVLTGRNGWPRERNPQLDAAIEQFAEPLYNFATNGQPMASDIGQLLKSIPNLVVNVPGMGNIDIAKLSPDLVQKVLNGEDVPGIPRETLDRVTKQIMERMYIAAARQQGLEPVNVNISTHQKFDAKKYLPSLNALPGNFVTQALRGQPLPHLDQHQTRTIVDYYTQQLPLDQSDMFNLSQAISPKMVQMLKLLPKNFNISELPPSVIKAAMKGEVPDLSELPPSVLQHFKDNIDEIMKSLNMGSSEDVPLEELIKKLPKFEHVEQSTFSPYDINDIDSKLVISERANAERSKRNRLYAAIALGLVGAASAAVLAAFAYRMYQRNGATRMVGPHQLPDDQLATSAMISGSIKGSGIGELTERRDQSYCESNESRSVGGSIRPETTSRHAF